MICLRNFSDGIWGTTVIKAEGWGFRTCVKILLLVDGKNKCKKKLYLFYPSCVSHCFLSLLVTILFLIFYLKNC